MRKVIAILLTGMLSLTMVACGGDKTESSSGGGNGSAADTVEVSQTGTGEPSQAEPDQPSRPEEDVETDTPSIPSSGKGDPIKYDLGYWVLECSINVFDYIYEKDGEGYVDLEKMITDAGWEVHKVDGVAWLPEARYYGDEYIVRLRMGESNDVPYASGDIVTTLTALAYEPSGISKDTYIGMPISLGLRDDSNPDRDFYKISTSVWLSIDYLNIVVFAYCLDHYPNSLELPVQLQG